MYILSVIEMNVCMMVCKQPEAYLLNRLENATAWSGLWNLTRAFLSELIYCICYENNITRITTSSEVLADHNVH